MSMSSNCPECSGSVAAGLLLEETGVEDSRVLPGVLRGLVVHT